MTNTCSAVASDRRRKEFQETGQTVRKPFGHDTVDRPRGHEKRVNLTMSVDFLSGEGIEMVTEI